MTSFGLTTAGFVPMMQTDIIAELQGSLRSAFGASANLADTSVFGQLVGVLSEREALLWQLAEAIYLSQYPSGAEGTSVDNILALNGMVRLKATATVTQPQPIVQANGVPLYGLLLYGTPGTVVDARSIIRNSASPPLSFLLDDQVIIGPPENAAQDILLSGVATSGYFRLGIERGSATIPSGAISYDASASTTVLNWGFLLRFGVQNLALAVDDKLIFVDSTPDDQGASAIQAALITAGYSATVIKEPVSTIYIFYPMYIAWSGFAPRVNCNPVTLTWDTLPTHGTFTFTVGGEPTVPLAYNASAADVQAAVRAISGFETVIVGAITNGYVFNWVDATPASITGVESGIGTMGVGFPNDVAGPMSVIEPVQSMVNGMTAPDGTRPYTDASVVALSAQSYRVTFGANAPRAGSPPSGGQAQPIMTVPEDPLFAGGQKVNAKIALQSVGHGGRGIGSATCTVAGPNNVPAGALTVIGTPVSGWSSVTNDLDAKPGRYAETDSEAMYRRSTLLSARASGPLQSIVARVLQLNGVTAAFGLANTGNAAQQLISFPTLPTSGSYRIVFPSGTVTVAAGASALSVQTAARALPSLGTVLIDNTDTGLSIDFNGSYGSQPQNLLAVVSNFTGQPATVTYGRPGKAFEIVVEGGNDTEIAQAIYLAQPAGIASYGNTAVTINDDYGSPATVWFSRPAETLVYVAINILTDTYNVPGDSSSGVNPSASWSPLSASQIQDDVVAAGNAVGIGGRLIMQGTGSLMGAFREVPGVLGVGFAVGLTPRFTPAIGAVPANIQFRAEQVPLLETFNVSISYA